MSDAEQPREVSERDEDSAVRGPDGDILDVDEPGNP